MQTENYFCGNTEKVPENAKDSIENSIAQVIGEESEDADDNPFIRAEESEAYKKLEREYREYRTKKVLSRVDGLITGAAPAADVKEEIKRVAASSGQRAVVAPCVTAEARRMLPAMIAVETLVDYPYASGGQKAVLAEIRGALQNKTDVCAAVNLSAYASGNSRPLDKRLRTLSKLGGRNRVTPMFRADGLGVEQTTRLALLVRRYKFSGVKIIVGDDFKKAADAVKIFCDAIGGQCRVEAVGNVRTAEEAEALFGAGAERIVTTDYASLSRQRLDNVTV